MNQGEDLIGEDQLPIDETELELGVSDDDAALGRPFGTPPVDGKRYVPGPLSEVCSDQFHRLIEAEVDVVLTQLALGRWCEHGIG